MSVEDIIYLLKCEVEQEIGRLTRDLEEALKFGQRMAADKKTLTTQNKRLIERVRELEEKYEPKNIPNCRSASRTQEDHPLRAEASAV